MNALLAVIGLLVAGVGTGILIIIGVDDYYVSYKLRKDREDTHKRIDEIWENHKK